MGKPAICIGENKGADQLRGNREADQRLCFRHSDSTIPLLLKSEISRFSVQLGLCRTCSETTLLVFPRGGLNVLTEPVQKHDSTCYDATLPPLGNSHISLKRTIGLSYLRPYSSRHI